MSVCVGGGESILLKLLYLGICEKQQPGSWLVLVKYKHMLIKITVAGIVKSLVFP